MQLFKPSKFNAEKCIKVLMKTRNAATHRTVLGSNASAWLAKFNRSSPSAAEADWGPWTRAQECSKVNLCASKR